MKITNRLNQSSRLLLILSLVWALVLLSIGAWWIYLIFNFENILSHIDRLKMTKMIIWEGGSFIILLFLISSSLLMLYLQDLKKTKSLQAFFASLTHELKTPLASIRLQSEVIDETLKSKKDDSLIKLSNRLIEDTNKLENQMDQILQLSRIERGGELNLSSLKLIPFIKSTIKKIAPPFQVQIETMNQEISIMADIFALELVMKNLLENTRVHTNSQKVTIGIKQLQKSIILTYRDEGNFFGEKSKLGTLFYKHNSTKGSGIGLYLSEKLMRKMKGKLLIQGDSKLIFELVFQTNEVENA